MLSILPVSFAINDGIYYWEFRNEDLLHTKFDSLYKAVTNLKPQVNLIEDNNSTENTIIITPNPVLSTLTIRGIHGYITIYNYIGNKVWEGWYTENREISTEQFPTGLYIIVFDNKPYYFMKDNS